MCVFLLGAVFSSSVSRVSCLSSLGIYTVLLLSGGSYVCSSSWASVSLVIFGVSDVAIFAWLWFVGVKPGFSDEGWVC